MCWPPPLTHRTTHLRAFWRTKGNFLVWSIYKIWLAFCARLLSPFLLFSIFFFSLVSLLSCSACVPSTDNAFIVFNAITHQFRGLVNHSLLILIFHTASDINTANTSCTHIVHSSLFLSLSVALACLQGLMNCLSRAKLVTRGSNTCGLCGWIECKETCQASKRITYPKYLDCSSASLSSKDEKICWETERPYTQGWAAADHKELMASIEIEQETCCSTTPLACFFPFAKGWAAALWLIFNKK